MVSSSAMAPRSIWRTTHGFWFVTWQPRSTRTSTDRSNFTAGRFRSSARSGDILPTGARYPMILWKLPPTHREFDLDQGACGPVPRYSLHECHDRISMPSDGHEGTNLARQANGERAE